MTSWIFKILQFFDYHATPDDERLQIASFYLDGAALSWFQWMHRNNQLTTWADFLNALLFGVAVKIYNVGRLGFFVRAQPK